MGRMRYFKELCAVLAIVLLSAMCGWVNDGGTVSAMGVFHTEQAKSDVDGVRVPIVLYHMLLKNPSYPHDYTISPAEFERDLKYMKENGYETVVISDLINYVYYGAPLPEKPVVISFDDGYYNNEYYGKPLLEQYGMRAVIAIVGEYSEASSQTGDINPAYSYLTWDQIKELGKSDVFEFANHTYFMHKNSSGRNGSMRMPGEDMAVYAQTLENDLTKLQIKLFEATGKTPHTFAYPFGAITKESKEIMKNMGFRASMTSAAGNNTIVRGDPDSLFFLRRNDRFPYTSAETILRKVN